MMPFIFLIVTVLAGEKVGEKGRREVEMIHCVLQLSPNASDLLLRS